MIITENESREVKSAINGRTTTSKNKASDKSKERLPSYKQPQYQADFNNLRGFPENNIQEVVEETQKVDIDVVSNGDDFNQPSEVDDGMTSGARGDDDKDDGAGTLDDENDDGSNAEDDNPVDVTSNVIALKATVDDTLTHIRTHLATKKSETMETLRDDMEAYRNQVSDLFGEFMMDKFSDDMIRHFEDLTIEHMLAKIDNDLDVKLEQMVRDASDGIDSLVLRDEDEGADVMTIDKHLSNFEVERKQEMEADIDQLHDDIKGGLESITMESTKIVIELLMKKLGYPVELRIDGEGGLAVRGNGMPSDVRFDAATALSAVKFVRTILEEGLDNRVNADDAGADNAAVDAGGDDQDRSDEEDDDNATDGGADDEVM